MNINAGKYRTKNTKDLSGGAAELIANDFSCQDSVRVFCSHDVVNPAVNNISNIIYLKKPPLNQNIFLEEETGAGLCNRKLYAQLSMHDRYEQKFTRILVSNV